jgi:hypothetical protein
MKIIIDTDEYTIYPEVSNKNELPCETIAKELRSLNPDTIKILLRMISEFADPKHPILTKEELDRITDKYPLISPNENLNKTWDDLVCDKD